MRHYAKRFLALSVAAALVITPVQSLRAEEVEGQTTGDASESVQLDADTQKSQETQENQNVSELPDEQDSNTLPDVKGNEDEQKKQTSGSVQNDGNIQSTAPIENNQQEIQEETRQEDPKEIFQKARCEADMDGNRLLVSVATDTLTYNKIYVGDKEDSVKEPAIEGEENAFGGYTFTFAAEKEKSGQKLSVVPYNKEKDEWYTEEAVFIEIPAGTAEEVQQFSMKTRMMTGIMPMTEPEESTSVLENGKYTVSEVTSSSSMFKVVGCTIKRLPENTILTIVLNGTGYDYLYYGTAEEAKAASEDSYVHYTVNADGKYAYTFKIPNKDFKLGEEIAIAAHSLKTGGFFDRKITIPSENIKAMETDAPLDGDYHIRADVSTTMINIRDCVLTSQNGEMMVALTLKTSSYSKLYLGTAANAEWNSDKCLNVTDEYQEDGETYRTFVFPLTALDRAIPIAMWSDSKNKWYDRTFIFNSDDMQKVEASEGSGSGSSGNTGSGTGNTGNTGNGGSSNAMTPDAESKYESDLSGSTGKVNSSTKLADGVYTPDHFIWSGGTGKVNITCTKITVKNGQAYATIVFSSGKYNYVKANGNKYYASHSGDTSSFTIPVVLNANNTIIGMTTAMSTAHEITYNIFIYLAAAAKADGTGGAGMLLGDSKTLDEEAPDILGLEYKGEVELEHAKYFKIYKYEQGITLLEIDMTSDTANEDEKDSEDDADDVGQQDAGAEFGDGSEDVSDEESVVKTEGEITAELYGRDIVKYLVVPEGVRIPAGLEKEAIVIEQPAEHVYTGSDQILERMDELDLLDLIAGVSCEQKDCDNEEIAQKMEKEEVTYAGTFDDTDYRALVAGKCDLAILPDDLLPQKDEKTGLSEEEQKGRLEEILGKYAYLGIPAVIDRSQDEEEELAKKEWLYVYGCLFNCEDEVEELLMELE